MFYVGNKMEIGEELCWSKLLEGNNARVSYNMQSAIGGLLKKKQNLDHVKLSWQFTVASRRVL